jgi:DnaJ family protein B protein 4
MGGMGGGMRGGPRSSGSSAHTPQQQAAPINHNLNVTLEELYIGATKRMRITKKVMDPSGQTSQVASDKEIQVKAGWKDGTKITFQREGDESPGTIPADIVFTVTTKPHDRFKRDGDNLEYTYDVSLAEALSGFRGTIRTLDGRDLDINMRNGVTPDTVTTITGEGMPNQKVSYN